MSLSFAREELAETDAPALLRNGIWLQRFTLLEPHARCYGRIRLKTAVSEVLATQN